MTLQKKKNFVDLTLDSSNQIANPKRKRKASKVSDCEKGFVCHKCTVGIIQHVSVSQHAGILKCWECHLDVRTDKISYCINENCGWVWHRLCYKDQKRAIKKKSTNQYKEEASDTDEDEERELDDIINKNLHQSHQMKQE